LGAGGPSIASCERPIIQRALQRIGSGGRLRVREAGALGAAVRAALGPIDLAAALRVYARRARPVERPRWDAGAGELWWRGRMVKRLRVDAANQAAVLAAFEAQGWPGRIDDPLPAGAGAKRRRWETVRVLNARLPAQSFRFRTAGRSAGIRWEVWHKRTWIGPTEPT